MDDGLLDVVLLPTRSRWGVLRWMMKARKGRHVDDTRLVHARGCSVQITWESGVLWQVDGDRPPEAAQSVDVGLEVVLEPAALPVLLPNSS